MFLGYPQGIKGYKVLDLTSNSIHISRNIIFYEHIFPYALSSQPSTSYLDDFIFPHRTSDSFQSIGINDSPSSTSILSSTMPIAPSDAALGAMPSAAPSAAPGVVPSAAPDAAHGEAPSAAHDAAPPASPNAASSAVMVLDLVQHLVQHLILQNLTMLSLFYSVQFLVLYLLLSHFPYLQLLILHSEGPLDHINLPLTSLNMPASLSALSLNLVCHMMFQLI